MIARGLVVADAALVTAPGAGGMLAPADAALLEQVLREFEEGGFQPPRLDELKSATPRTSKRIAELVDWAVARGRLVRIAEGIWLHAERWDELVALVTGSIRARGPLPVSEIRTMLDSSRKFVVPIVERLDALRITRRQGDLRGLGESAPNA